MNNINFNVYDTNNISFCALWKKKSNVIVPPETKAYSLESEILKKDNEDKFIRQSAAKSLIHDNYREKNTPKERVFLLMNILALFFGFKLASLLAKS